MITCQGAVRGWLLRQGTVSLVSLITVPSLTLAFVHLRPTHHSDSRSLELISLGRKSQRKDFRRDKEEGLRRDPACPFDGAAVRSFPENYSGRVGLLSPSCGHKLGMITEGRQALR